MPARRNWFRQLSKPRRPTPPNVTPPTEKATVASVQAAQEDADQAIANAATVQSAVNALAARPNDAAELAAEDEIDVYQSGVRVKTTLGDLKSFINGG